MKNHQATFRRAVTLTELLVVLAIISLLATLAVPVFVQKTEQARRATARFEVREIANAEEVVAITHSFYVPLHILDNQPNLPTGVTSPNPRDDFDGYASSTGGLGSIQLVNPFSNVQQQQGSQLAFNSSDSRVTQMITYWTGPFLNPVRVYRGTDPDNDPSTMTQDEVSHDFILDPWGGPYRFYSPEGLISTQSTSQNIPSSGNDIDDGFLSNNDDRFERYAVVSYGSNGEDDGTTTVDDDIYYEFGFEGNESAFNIF